ncbi:hypothetical protein PHLCEN_2v10039 [Hermanssonia centrifuga]|uniref:Uncharacterized protein n=1 Tax=Hermanssonia centrifuga TaxID=98765 RepID=A0A2R6NP27_9APHY|nr:hypothetical protein PHLCEN_2v10039 [Hermanssonia centrifuga]
MRYIIQEQCNRKLIPSGLDSRPTSSLQLHIAGPIFQVSIIDIMEDWFEDYGFTDVHRAVLCHRDNGASLRNILQHSPADINTPCRRELTPLEWGVSMFIPDVVEILSECGADVHKNHPLHRAAESGNLGAFKSLIRFGADINLQDHVGRTALHRVAYWGYPAVVEELVQSHGDNLRLDLLDHSGRTVFDEIEHGSAYYKAMRWSTRGHDRIFNLLSHLRTSRAITDPHRSGSDGDVDFRIPGTFPKD